MGPDQQNPAGDQPPAPDTPASPPAPGAPAPAPAPEAPTPGAPAPAPTPDVAAPQPAAPTADATPAAPAPGAPAPAPAPAPGAPAPAAPGAQPAAMGGKSGGSKKMIMMVVGGVVGLVVLVLIVMTVLGGGGGTNLSDVKSISEGGATINVPSAWEKATDSSDEDITFYSHDSTIEDNDIGMGFGVDTSGPSGVIEGLREQFGESADPVVELFATQLSSTFGSGADNADINVAEYSNDRLILDITFTGANNFFEEDATVTIRYVIENDGTLAFAFFAYVGSQDVDDAAVTAIIQSLEV